MYSIKANRLVNIVILILLISACELNNMEPQAEPAQVSPANSSFEEPSATPDPSPIKQFYDFMATAEPRPLTERQEQVNLYTGQIESFPLIDEENVIFVWRGEGDDVRLVGDMNNWKPERGLQLTHLEGTDLWYLELKFEPSARLDYRYLIDGEDLRLDPLNPHLQISGIGPNSVLVMPQYESVIDDLPDDADVPKGNLTTHTIESEYLQETRTIYVYTPPGQLVGQRLPSVYINDGSDYLNLISAPTMLDKLIAYRELAPLVAVFIPPINRSLEYDLNDSYVKFLADEVVPYIQKNYDTDISPENTGVMGASMGGRAALYTALERPDVFGLVASQSGAIVGNDDSLLRAFEAANQAQAIEGQIHTLFKPYLVVGAYETAIGDYFQGGNFAAGNRDLAEKMRLAGYNLEYEEYPEGHSWGLWRNTFGLALAALFNK